MSTTPRRLPRPLRQAGRPDPRSRVPDITVVLPVYDPPLDALRIQLEMLTAQSFEHWECVVVDDSSTRADVRHMLDEWAALEPRCSLILRATNGGIAAATNDGIDAAIGKIITLADHDDVMDRDALRQIVDHFERHSDHDVVYTDEQLIDEHGRVIDGYPKPDYSPHRHLGQHYLAHMVAARRNAIGDLRVRCEFEPSQDYDFWMRVIEAAESVGRRVGHIPATLYSWRAIAGSSALDAAEKPEMCDAVRRCVQATLDRRGIGATAETVMHDGLPTTSVRHVFSSSRVPTIAHIPLTSTSTAAEVNAAVAAVGDHEVVCLAPDDASTPNWAAPLACRALQQGVGAVGPKLLTTDGTILSIGRVVQPTLEDVLAGEPGDSPGPWGSLFVAREVSAIAPKGLTMSRELFGEFGGLESDVSLDVAIAELCRRLADQGHATLFDPDVTLTVNAHSLDINRDGLATARAQQPDLWTERFSPLGTVAALGHRPNAFEQLDELMAASQVELITSDVFDTLVTRPAATPSDIFVLLADRIELPAHVTPSVFSQARRAAERRARRLRADARRRTVLANEPEADEAQLLLDPDIAAPEVTLEEIYGQMPADWGDAATMLTAELALEADALRPIPETIAAFERARSLGLPVILVSDIYLTAPQLTFVLSAAGVDMSLVDQVITSADHRLGKAHGLLQFAIAERGVDPQRVAHVGDNEVADIRTAVELGAQSIHVDLASDLRHVELPAPALRAWSSTEGTDLGISAAVRAVLVDDGSLGRDPSFQYGAAVIGPALAGFSRWVAATTSDLGATSVHCMLREGATIAELVATTAPEGPTPIPLHVSRWVTMRAAVIDGTTDELVTALARRADLTVQHIVDAFGCDEVRVRSLVGTRPTPPNALVDTCRKLAEDSVLRGQIVEHARQLRERVLIYLRSHVNIESGPIVVADVGWGGTIQEGLTRILRSDGIHNDVIGLYLALSAPGEERVAQGARMVSYLPNITDDVDASKYSRTIAHHADTVERIMTPAIGTLIDIDAHGAPVCRPVVHDPIPPTLQSAQRAMRAVVDRLNSHGPSEGTSDLDDPRWTSPSLRVAFAKIIADAVVAPSRHLAEALGAWPHDDVAGTAHRSIAGAELAAAVKYANVRDLDFLDPSGRSWVAGLAGASNRSLSTQLRAELEGIALDGLAPESEGGVARLAAFHVGSDLAAIQVGRPVSVAPAGWSVLRISGAVDSLRSIRFDAAETAALVEVVQFAVRLGTTRMFDPSTRDVDLTDADLTWVEAHSVDGQHFAQRSGGHVLLDLDPSLANEVRSVDVTVAFRCWRLDDGDPMTRTPPLQRVSSEGRRVASAIKRRL